MREREHRHQGLYQYDMIPYGCRWGLSTLAGGAATLTRGSLEGAHHVNFEKFDNNASIAWS